MFNFKILKMKKSLIIFSVLFMSLLVSGHEYVLLAYKYKVQKGDSLEMHLFVADGFNIQLERPMQTAITKKFELITQQGTTDLLAETKDQSLPVVNMKVDFDGQGLLHMERDYSRISLPTDKFLAYLKEDHIENITVKKDPAKKMQRERYSRYIKALVQSGKPGNDTLYKKKTGQLFEIILLQNPYLIHAGDMIKAQVFFMNKPLRNKVITARNRTGNENTLFLTSRTNSNGICSFNLPRKGEWFIHATQMIPCPDPTDSDWESFWTSYSFEIQ